MDLNNFNKHQSLQGIYCSGILHDPFECALITYILKRKRNATLSKTVVSSFSSNNSASDYVIAKYRYLHQIPTAVTYGWRAATRNVRQPPFLKSKSSKHVPILRKNVLNH